MQCILVCFLKSLQLIKFGKIKYRFTHHVSVVEFMKYVF